MWLGKLTITVLSTFCGYLLITHIDAYSTQIYSPFMPILVIYNFIQFFVVISLIVAHFFMDVFGISADTLLLGYCLEMDILKGKAIACPPALK